MLNMLKSVKNAISRNIQAAKSNAQAGFSTVKTLVATAVTSVTAMFTISKASAAPVDLTTLTAAVDFSTVIVAILAVAAIMVGVYVAWKAAKMVLGAVKGL